MDEQQDTVPGDSSYQDGNGVQGFNLDEQKWTDTGNAAAGNGSSANGHPAGNGAAPSRTAAAPSRTAATVPGVTV